MNETMLTKATAVPQQAPLKLQGPLGEGLQEYTGTWNTAQVVHLFKKNFIWCKAAGCTIF